MINFKNHFLGIAAVASMIFASACSDKVDFDNPSLSFQEQDNIVTLSVYPETQLLAVTEDEEEEEEDQTHGKKFTISDGSQVDMLVFAVYRRQNKTDDFVIAKDADGTYPYVKPIYHGEDDKVTINGKTISVGEGQNVIPITENFFPYRFQFVTEEGYEYKVAFWAQSSKTEAYDTSNLKEVKVRYKDSQNKNALNNDEERDAFCGVTAEIAGGKSNTIYPVVLKRPFAQINVGTTGWDYEGPAVLKPAKISYVNSKVTIEGAAQYYNVLADKTLYDEDKYPLVDVVYELNLIPAYIHKPNIVESAQDGKAWYEPIDEEEFLYVDTDGNKKFDDYIGWFKYLEFRDKDEYQANNGKIPPTEVFKYLSMSYILIPETESEDKATTIDSFKLEMQGVEETTQTSDSSSGDETGTDGYLKEGGINELMELKNIPVRKNWRTNILGNSFFVSEKIMTIDIYPIYCGDYDNEYTNGKNWYDDVVVEGSGVDATVSGGHRNENFGEYDNPPKKEEKEEENN